MHKKLSTIADIDVEVSHDKWLTGDAAEEGQVTLTAADDEMGYMPIEDDDVYAF